MLVGSPGIVGVRKENVIPMLPVTKRHVNEQKLLQRDRVGLLSPKVVSDMGDLV